jgi:hypothetical protein
VSDSRVSSLGVRKGREDRWGADLYRADCVVVFLCNPVRLEALLPVPVAREQ